MCMECQFIWILYYKFNVCVCVHADSRMVCATRAHFHIPIVAKSNFVGHTSFGHIQNYAEM